MKIGIHANWLYTGAGGPETYVAGLINGLAKIDRENEYIIYVSSTKAVEQMRLPTNYNFEVLWPSTRWIEVPVSFPLALMRHKLDLVHLTYVAPPIFPGKAVFTVHDLSPFSHPQFYPLGVRTRLRYLISRGIQKAEHILCVSNTTKSEIAKRFRIPEERLTVTYNGTGKIFKKLERSRCICELKKNYNIRNDFILHVGKIQSRKNIRRLLEAYHKLLKESQRELDLVLVGRVTWLSKEILEAIGELNLSDRVHLIGHVPVETLVMFYNACSVFVFPSLFEGFGIPVIEAMACGAPVVASKESSLPEVSGDAALHFDPVDTNQMASCIERILTDTELREDLITRGFERAAQFSWEETARRTLSVYKSVFLGNGKKQRVS